MHHRGTVTWRGTVSSAVLALLVAACSPATQADAPGPDGSSGAQWDDGRVSFTYPDGWEVTEEGGAAEYTLRIEPPGARDQDPDVPTSAIVLFWPFLGQQSLEAVANHWGADTDDPVVSDVEEQDIELSGASEALRQDYRVLDVSDDPQEGPFQFRTALAMGDGAVAGRDGRGRRGQRRGRGRGRRPGPRHDRAVTHVAVTHRPGAQSTGGPIGPRHTRHPQPQYGRCVSTDHDPPIRVPGVERHESES